MDAAESHEAEARAVNGHGPARLAGACRVPGTILLHISTDYVFSGGSDRPYRGTGHVVRTAWLHGAGASNFVRTMIRLEAVDDVLHVVDDQRGQSTWTGDVADPLIRLVNFAREGTAPPGVYHAANSGQATWNWPAREVFRLLGAARRRVQRMDADHLEAGQGRAGQGRAGQGRAGQGQAARPMRRPGMCRPTAPATAAATASSAGSVRWPVPWNWWQGPPVRPGW
ncbi:sugar nucleotide-binding protein [Streptomyces sp. NPDC054837]